MPLTIPHYQLEEILDVHLKAPNDSLGFIKVRLISIIENESYEHYAQLSIKWLELIDLDPKQLPFYEEENFYVGQLLKPVHGLSYGELILIPESYIDRELTKSSQEEPCTIVFDFKFDYGNKVYPGINDLIQSITEEVYEKTAMQLSGRSVTLFKEDDVKAIMTLLKVYYKVEDNEYNRASVKNILCSAAIRQTVESKATNKKIEIYIDSTVRNKLICTVYNKKNKEQKEFYF